MRTWREAMEHALYGPGGFYRLQDPADHFRTSVRASPLYAGAVAVLAERVDEALGRPAVFDLVDVGAGRGELLRAVVDAVSSDLRGRLRPVGVEMAGRPSDLPAQYGWASEVPPLEAGLLVANEWLDNVPLDVVEQTQDGPRLVLVDQDGTESLGGPPDADDLAWLDTWWPLEEAGDRAEVGRPRDLAWSSAVGRVQEGLAVAVDYAHDRAARVGGGYLRGTLTGYRDGRAVRPVPDGTCDLTAHVALDSCAAATGGRVLSQREALRALGVTGELPPRELASSDPAAYVKRLSRSGEAAELLDPAGLGGFGWLVHGAGISDRIVTERYHRGI